MDAFNQWAPAIGLIITSIVIPFAVNICTTVQSSSVNKRVVAIIFSILGGLAVALVSGIPTPDTILTWCFAVLGGTQVAYTAFKEAGITSKWLDALMNIGVKPKE